MPAAAPWARATDWVSTAPAAVGIRAAMAVTHTAPSSAIAVARWASTIIGGNSNLTVTAPSATCTASRPTATVAGITRSRRLRQATQATTAVTTTRTLVSDAVVRCEYSMMACTSSGGRNRP